MTRIRIDLRSKTPIYRQVAEALRRDIAGGGLPPGSQLPTVRELGAELRVNFNTVARAYRMLDATGLISTQQGRGSYVQATEGPRATERLRRAALRELVQSFLRDASRLGVPPEVVADETLRSLRRWQAQGRSGSETGRSA
jgi:GntR family transcriptional regulator